MPSPRRLLIANRGEIAVRVARAARDLGIETVAVYSTADRSCRHVEVADRAVCIGPPPAAASYLRREVLVHVAEATGCDAVHPGYGFLAEDATFAQHVQDAGLAWVGPDPDTIRQMGDKAAARAAAVEADVPVVPGSEGLLASDDDAREFGRQHGFPLLLKASAGGGGKGMRVVERAEDLARLLALARDEAGGAFGDDSMYVERFLPHVRHVEVQVIGDGCGAVLSLGDRDCSLQRRHQKLVEEAPASLPEPIRTAMSRTAVQLAASVKYRNAGTIEFLLDTETGEFFFIEMNTRIQVEHPVSEEVTGIDLVAWQLRVAGGEEISALDNVNVSGHAIEYRITSEDPDCDFAPRPGRLTAFEVPGGPGVRCDTHVTAGYDVPPYYDSLLAKLVIWGRNREEALARSRRALRELRVEGTASTLGFHRWLLDQPEFVAGTHTTTYLTDAMGRTRSPQEDAT